LREIMPETRDFAGGLEFIVDFILKSNSKPAVVTVEGLQNTGKSKLIELLVNRLTDLGLTGRGVCASISSTSLQVKTMARDYLLVEGTTGIPRNSDVYVNGLYNRDPDLRICMLNTEIYPDYKLLKPDSYDLIVNNPDSDVK